MVLESILSSSIIIIMLYKCLVLVAWLFYTISRIYLMEILSETDLHLLLDYNAISTFFIKSGYNNEELNIKKNDLFMIDRSLYPVNESLIVCALNRELTIRKYFLHDDVFQLYDGKELFKPKEANDFEVWGVIAHVIRKLRVKS